MTANTGYDVVITIPGITTARQDRLNVNTFGFNGKVYSVGVQSGNTVTVKVVPVASYSSPVNIIWNYLKTTDLG
ncbi:MAG: hypothetical protein ACRC1M_08545 [Methanobacteriaceae archaeon]